VSHPFQNGTRKAAMWVGIAGGICVLLTSVGSFYAGWSRKIGDAVIMQRMVNADDETLRQIVPKVESCHTNNDRQDGAINQSALDNQRQDAAILALTQQVSNLAGIVQLDVQSRMKAGEIQR
jgi:hypothetical protein